MIKTAKEVITAGWYWWRFRHEDAWQPEYFDPVNRPAEIKLMGGYFIGPIYPCEEAED